MPDKRNILWEKHRMYLPDMRNKAIHRCRHCKFFVAIKGRMETRNGCVINIRSYGNLEKRIPSEIPIMEIIKRVGIEGLNQCLKYNGPDAQSCERFAMKLS